LKPSLSPAVFAGSLPEEALSIPPARDAILVKYQIAAQKRGAGREGRDGMRRGFVLFSTWPFKAGSDGCRRIAENRV